MTDSINSGFDVGHVDYSPDEVYKVHSIDRDSGGGGQGNFRDHLDDDQGKNDDDKPDGRNVPRRHVPEEIKDDVMLSETALEIQAREVNDIPAQPEEDSTAENNPDEPHINLLA